MKELTWKPILSNLTEACSELRDLHCRLYYLSYGGVPCNWEDGDSDRAWLEKEEKRCPFTEFSLFVSLDHAYHHINWSWNVRRTPEKRACLAGMDSKEADRYFRRYSRFPKTRDFTDLWLPREILKRRGKEPGLKKISLTPVRLCIHAALRKLRILCYLVAREAGDNSNWSVRPKDLAIKEDSLPLTEKEFARMIHSIYEFLNQAWNRRRDKTFFIAKYCITRRKCFPPEFMPGILSK